ncbi:low molecular weight phosphotyrosine protein phosphatase [Piscinibacter aquaticus]|uniref:protein-tyrosine-phosphatase n=1 Tax=Piscinibacter aquaticus TaxID=392597 RepID=A0A5C6U145_9BURK|nr:low molecular weight phosphotyrosine protein phosphatase [Piscinibacter aquaticus]
MARACHDATRGVVANDNVALEDSAVKITSVLFVCMGNICRSPTAEAVMRHKLQQAGLHGLVMVDSAGTHAWHAGSPPDHRSMQHAARRGYDLSALRAREVVEADFERFDLILAMDWDNLALLEERCPDARRRKLGRLTEFCRRHESPVVPDPYAGGAQGFEEVLDGMEDACDGLLERISRQTPAR